MMNKIEKNFFVFEIIGYDIVTLSCLYQEENTCHWHSLCWEAVLRFSYL